MREQEAGRARSARTAAGDSGKKSREVRCCTASGGENLAAGGPDVATCGEGEGVGVGEVFGSVEEHRGRRACYHPPVGSAHSPRFHRRRSLRLPAPPPLWGSD